MPSTKDPNLVLIPGPGRLPAGSVPASSLLFSTGNNSGLAAHIGNALDAHMATAIGVHAYYLNDPSNSPLLSTVGGPYDGESVEDALSQLAALLPVKPNPLGFSAPIPNNISPLSGVPSWGAINSAIVGGFKNGSAVTFTKYLAATAAGSFAVTGTLFPADRGTLVLYRSTDVFTTFTPLAALWLGSGTAPDVTIGAANFVEASRAGLQTNHTGTGTSPAVLDLISLTFRLPYLTDYTSYAGSGYPSFSTTFPAYQLAKFSIAAQTLIVGNAGSYILVHWKESIGASTILTPAAGDLTSAKCYSAVGSFDAANVSSVNRKNVFRDTNSGTLPAGVGGSFTATPTGGTTVNLSGVAHYTGTSLAWSGVLQADNLFNTSFLTGSQANVGIPSGYETGSDPLRINFADFGGGTLLVPYYNLHLAGGPGTPYSASNPPVTTDRAEYDFTSPALTIASPTTNSAATEAVIRGELRRPPLTGQSVVAYNSGLKFLFNNYTQTGTSNPFLGQDPERFETFVNEQFRYVKTATHTIISTDPIQPGGGNVFNTATTLTASDNNLQVLNGLLVYPTKNFTSGYAPAGPNYAFSESGGGLVREYVRIFNAQGSATGRITLIGTLGTTVSGLSFAFQGSGNSATNDSSNHTGGIIVEIRAAADPTWRDLGRLNGAGTGCLNVTASVTGSGSSVSVDCSYVLPVAPVNNGGKFPLAIRVTFIKNVGTPTAQNLSINSIAWNAS